MTLLQNTPNILTFSRIFFTLIFLIVLFLPFDFSYLIALVIFFLASITDYLDGKIARWQNATSELGAFLDPLADKLLIIGAFIAFVDLKLVPGWMVLVIITREFLITGLRLLAVSQGSSISVSRIAKHKTLSQMLAVYLILIYLCFKDFLSSHLNIIYFQTLVFIFLYIMIFLTIISGLGYIYHNRNVFRRRYN